VVVGGFELQAEGVQVGRNREEVTGPVEDRRVALALFVDVVQQLAEEHRLIGAFGVPEPVLDRAAQAGDPIASVIHMSAQLDGPGGVASGHVADVSAEAQEAFEMGLAGRFAACLGDSGVVRVEQREVW